MISRIGIITAGNDVPGLNAAIRAIGKTALETGIEVIGFHDGFNGLITNNGQQLLGPDLSGIITLGGTILGTSEDLPGNGLESKLIIEKAKATYRKQKLDALIVLGGAIMQNGAYALSQAGLNILSLPKSISNDLAFTDYTIGFDTALTVATEAIDRLHSTAYSHHRIIIVEILGRHAGWLTLGAGIAGGADIILIPEIPYSMKNVAGAIEKRKLDGKKFSIVAVSEGALTQENVDFFTRNKEINRKMREGVEFETIHSRLKTIENQYADNTNLLSQLLRELTGIDTRVTILGLLLRGGTPSAIDRLRATQLGSSSISFLQSGSQGVMLAFQDNQVVGVPLKDVAGRHNPLPIDHTWIDCARKVGTCFGDE
ncbi:MAG: hypothetical protein BGO78_16585 [Chloroflexi bacterium 44-23]|nr:MAG: hypothetical protein BGO78_16585 [Chloroflexi bacterium 44-23]